MMNLDAMPGCGSLVNHGTKTSVGSLNGTSNLLNGTTNLLPTVSTINGTSNLLNRTSNLLPTVSSINGTSNLLQNVGSLNGTSNLLNGTSNLLPTLTSLNGTSDLLPTSCNLNGTSNLLPPVGTSSLLRTACNINGTSSLLPPVGTSSLLPTVGSSSLLPTVGTSSLLPTVGTSSLLPYHHTNNQMLPVSNTVCNQEKGLNNQKLSNHNHNHHENLIQTAKYYCEKQEYVDLAIHCEDGVIHAHQIVLAVASPMLKELFLTNPTHGMDALVITLPEVKSCLVQALIHFVYTGNVVTQKGQFYSLMKLVYALNINGLIEAESTKNLPTKFQTVIQILGKKKRGDDCDECVSRKRQKLEDDPGMDFSCLELRPQSNVNLKVNGSLPKLQMQSMSLPRIPMPQLTKTVSSMSSHPNSMPTLSSHANSMPMSSHANPMPSHTSLPSSSTISSTRVVNSLTASGVVIKEEPEEKPNISMMTNFVAVSNPVKMEHPSYISSSISGSSSRPSSLSNTSPGSILSIANAGTGTGSNHGPGSILSIANAGTGTGSSSTTQTKEGGSDDPLAAIMNQTIFGGEAMFIVGTQVNGKQYLEIPGGACVTAGPGAVKLVEEGQRTSSSWGGAVREEVPRPSVPPPLQALPPHQEEDSPNKGALASSRGGLTSETVDDLPCTPDDEDLNISYNCETCNRSIKGRVMLQAHQYQEHFDNPEYDATSIPDEKFACRVCLKVFTRNSDVKAHILRVHCGDRRYPCTMCGKRFKESTHLRKHLYTHTGERPHYCHLCTKGFQTSSDLKRHKRTRVHQERVEQLNNGKLADTEGVSMDNNAEFNRWTDETEEEIDGPGGRLNPNRLSSTSNIQNRQNSGLYLPIQSKPPTRPPPPSIRATPTTRPPQTFPPRLSSSSTALPCLSSSSMPSLSSPSMVTLSMTSLCNSPTLLPQFPVTTTPISHFFTSPSINFTTTTTSPSIQFSTTSSPSLQFSTTSSPSIQFSTTPSSSLQFSTTPSSTLQYSTSSSNNSNYITSNGNFSSSGQFGTSNNFSSSPQSALSIINQSNSTLDISDIKWGLGGSVLESRDELFPTGGTVITVKRSVSTDSPHDGERLTIQEDSMDV